MEAGSGAEHCELCDLAPQSFGSVGRTERFQYPNVGVPVLGVASLVPGR